MASLLAAMNFSCQMLPEFSGEPPKLTPSSSAHAENFTDEQIKSYAQAVLQIETGRQQAYETIQKIIGSTPPPITCNQPDTLNKLPKDAQEVAVNYCLESKKIAEDSGLTNEVFNTITLRLKDDQELKIKVQNEMIRIQREAKK